MMKTCKVADHLSVLLADLYTLSLKAQNFHWHVKGPLFAVHHALFGDIYEEVSDLVDDVAERIRTVDCMAPATFSEFSKLRTLDDGDKTLSPMDMIAALLKDYVKLTDFMQKAVPLFQKEGDEASADMTIGYMATFEKRIWMLKSHLA